MYWWAVECGGINRERDVLLTLQDRFLCWIRIKGKEKKKREEVRIPLKQSYSEAKLKPDSNLECLSPKNSLPAIYSCLNGLWFRKSVNDVGGFPKRHRWSSVRKWVRSYAFFPFFIHLRRRRRCGRPSFLPPPSSFLSYISGYTL